MPTFRTYITKQESIYCGFSPELKVFSYAACSEEAINGLPEEFSRQNLLRTARRDASAGEGRGAMPSEDHPLRCPVCRRGYRSHSSLKSHLNEHTPTRRCRNCGKQLRDNEYHRC